jgi:hypothetical protein
VSRRPPEPVAGSITASHTTWSMTESQRRAATVRSLLCRQLTCDLDLRAGASHQASTAGDPFRAEGWLAIPRARRAVPQPGRLAARGVQPAAGVRGRTAPGSSTRRTIPAGSTTSGTPRVTASRSGPSPTTRASRSRFQRYLRPAEQVRAPAGGGASSPRHPSARTIR